MSVEMSDWQIARLVKVGRYLLKSRRDWLVKYGDDFSCFGDDSNNVPPMPDCFTEYLYVRGVVRDALKFRRDHKKAVDHVWKVYAESVVESLKKKGLEECSPST